MQWLNSSPKKHRIGHSQEASVIKWKWYIQDRHKAGFGGLAVLHEKFANGPASEAANRDCLGSKQESPVNGENP